MLAMTAEAAVRFRVVAHGLDLRRPASTPLHELAPVALPDYPPGASLRSLAVRRAGVDQGTLGAALRAGEAVRAPSLRGTTHVFASRDAAVFGVAVLPTPGDEEAAAQALGSAWPPLPAQGIEAMTALARVTEEVADAVADGRPRARGEISSALHGRLPENWEPWCPRCQAHHVPEMLFRLALVAAGLRFAEDGVALVAGARPDPAGHAEPRRELVRRFMRLYAPATANGFAEWSGLGASEARASIAALRDELVEVKLADRRALALTTDLDRLADPAAPAGVRLVPAGDPFLHQRDRSTLLPDREQQRGLWRPAGAPGLLLVDGVPAGTWRHRRHGGNLAVTIDGWRRLDGEWPQIEQEAAVLAAAHGSELGAVERD